MSARADRSLAEFARYASQNVLGMLGLSCYILADTYFISQGLGAEGLTALNLAIPFYNFIQGAGLMVGMGGATRFALLRGQGEPERARAVFTRSLVLALLLSLAFVLPGAFLSQQLSALLGAQGAVRELTAVYLRVLLLFAPAFLVNNVCLCFVRNDGGPRLAMAAMLGGSFSNIVLDYLFIFPLEMGMFGAVLATGFAPVISIAILTPRLRRPSLRLTVRGAGLGGAGRLAALGAPSLVTEVSSGLVLALFNFIILDLAGGTGVAAYGVVATIYLVVMALFTGLGQGIQPLVSTALGRGERDTARRVYRYALRAALALAAAVYLLVLFFPGPIVDAFNREGDPVLGQIAVRGLRLYFTAFFFSGFNVVTAVYFSSLERARAGFVVSALRGFVLIIPLALSMARLWGMDGVWLSAPAAEGLTAVAALVLLAPDWRTLRRRGRKADD